MGNFYEDTRECGHCDKVTLHKCRDSGHERDSSDDYRECLECHWRRFGISGEYEPPFDES